MADDIGKTALDIIKLSPRWLAAPLLICGTLIFAPSALLVSLGLNDLLAVYRGYVGFAFLCTASLFVVGAIVGVYQHAHGFIALRRSRTKRRARMRERLLDLTETEKQILRYYVIEKTRTNYLRIDDGVVMGLARVGIIFQAALIGDVVDGFAFNISDDARELLSELPDALIGTTADTMTHKSPWS